MSAKLYLRIGKSRSEAAEALVARFRCGGASPDAHKARGVAILTAVNGASHSSSEALSTVPVFAPPG